MHLAIAGPVIPTTIKVVQPVAESLQMLLQAGVAIIGLAMRVTKRVEKLVSRKLIICRF